MAGRFRALVLLGLLAAPGALAAQTARGVARTEPEARIEEGDELHQRMRPRDALVEFERILEREPRRYEALWRAAREAVTLGMLTRDDEAREEWYGRALELSERAVEVDPDGLSGRHWLAVSLGRQALVSGPRTRVEMAGRIRENALRVLERDPDHAGAHHVLGEWHAEIMRLSGVTRFLARKLLGAHAFDEASWDEAERHLRRSVEVEPSVLIHRVALARVLMDRDRSEEAREQLREVLERPALDPVDPLQKQEAQELLREL